MKNHVNLSEKNSWSNDKKLTIFIFFIGPGGKWFFKYIKMICGPFIQGLECQLEQYGLFIMFYIQHQVMHRLFL